MASGLGFASALRGGAGPEALMTRWCGAASGAATSVRPRRGRWWENSEPFSGSEERKAAACGAGMEEGVGRMRRRMRRAIRGRAEVSGKEATWPIRLQIRDASQCKMVFSSVVVFWNKNHERKQD